MTDARGRRGVLGALAAASLSGCLRLAGGSEESTPTVATGSAGGAGTDADTPGGDGEAADEMPVGMDGSGVSPLLADAHQQAMMTLPSASVSYEFERLWNGTFRSRESADIEGTFANWTFETPAYTFEKHLVGEGTKRSTWRTTGDDPVYGDVEKPGGPGLPWNNLVRADEVEWVVAAGDFDAPERTGDGEAARFTTRADAVADEAPLFERYDYLDADRVESFAATLTAREDGTVEELESEVRVVVDEELVTLTQHLETGGFGATTVTEPGWLGTARDRAPDFGLRTEGEHVVVEHAGGDPVPGDSRADMHQHQGEYGGGADLPAPLRAGEELWLWREGSEVFLSHGEPAGASPDPLDGETVVRVGLHKGAFAKALLERIDR